MSQQFDAGLRDAWNDLYESNIGTSPILQFFSGAQPANCAAADAGTKLAEGALPSNWMGNSAAGVKAIAGAPWVITGVSGAGAGTAMAHWRLKESTGTTCKHQGSVTVTAGGGDVTVDNTSIANLQVMNVNTWSLTAPGV